MHVCVRVEQAQERSLRLELCACVVALETGTELYIGPMRRTRVCLSVSVLTMWWFIDFVH